MGTKINDIPIVLHTMDSYSKFWNPWYYFFKKHVTNYGPIYFLSEEKEPDFVNEVIHIKTGKGEWGERLLKGLKEVDSELIFYMQEDFWAYEDFELSDSLLKRFLEYEMDCLRISENTIHYTLNHIEDNLFKYNQNSNYTMSHQFSLWNKFFFTSNILESENPWDNEIIGSRRLRDISHKIYIITNKWYETTCTKGNMNESGERLMEKYLKEKT